jgi:hypothetical protein
LPHNHTSEEMGRRQTQSPQRFGDFEEYQNISKIPFPQHHLSTSSREVNGGIASSKEIFCGQS